MQKENSTKVLFVSKGGDSRCVIAKALANSLSDGMIQGFCAEIRPENSLNSSAVKVMKEIGLEINSEKTRAVKEIKNKDFDVIITLCDKSSDKESSSCLCNLKCNELEPLQRDCSILTGLPMQLNWTTLPLAGPSEPEEVILQSFRRLRDEYIEYITYFNKLGGFLTIKKQNQRLDQIFDFLEEGIIIHDEFRNIYVFNKEAERITGLAKEEVIGRDCHQVILDGLCGGQCDFCSEERKAVSLATEKIHKNLKFTDKNGVDKVLGVTVTPVFLEREGLRGVMISFRDITELHELRWKLKKSRSFHGMIGVSQKMQDIFATIQQVAVSDYPILITGESGTGKELVASAIHEESRRRGGPFIAVNCGAIPETILESELFGHVKGAFTGAIRDKKGRFELANHGTIFLDEVGDLSPAFQVKLLRVLQEKKFEPIGGEKTISVDVRIISATNKNLRKLVSEGHFREDLFYRLSVVPIILPPLRERKQDLPHLVQKILEDISKESGRAVYFLTNEGLDLLHNYNWPGNIRELINTLQYATIRTQDNEISLESLPPEIRYFKALSPILKNSGTIVPENEDWASLQVLAKGQGGTQTRPLKLNRQSVVQALKEAGGNKVKAAKILGVGRATLYRFFSTEQLDETGVSHMETT